MKTSLAWCVILQSNEKLPEISISQSVLFGYIVADSVFAVAGSLEMVWQNRPSSYITVRSEQGDYALQCMNPIKHPTSVSFSCICTKLKTATRDV